jgi:uncharacterized membrane protein YqiK
MTQTTAGRITEIIREHLKFYAGSGEWAAAVEAGQEIAAEIDALTRERDEARAELAGLDAGMRFQFDRAEDYKAQRDEARAEAERLRPAAEAWEALQAAYHPGRGSSLEYAYSVACVERAGVLRARKAAKEGKP